ncbi:MAG TPA: MAPEG family protein [Pseudolabrys sp.]|nr:MAPEG family protein [Pseudolabrys sp.]
MSYPAILAPLFVEVLLTFVLLVWLANVRVAAVKGGKVHPRDIVLGQPNWPAQETQIGNAYHNQFQLPVLFYVLTILALVTRHADLIFVVMAWIFVLLRLAHATIHVTTNRLISRFRVFALGFGVLALMWLIFIVRILLALP